MQIISEWRKRPAGYKLRHDEKMVMAISDGRTQHLRVNNNGEVVQAPKYKLNADEEQKVRSHVQKKAFEALVGMPQY